MQTLSNDTTITARFEYDFTGRVIGLIFRILVILIGIFLLQVNEIWLTVISLILIFFGTIGFIDLLLFSSFTFYNDKIIKTWFLLGRLESSFNSLVAAKSNSFYGGGTIKFWQKGKRVKQVLFFGLDLLPLTKEDVEKIKDILVCQKIIEENNLVWQT